METLAALVILAAIGAFAAPLFLRSGNAEVTAEARALAADLRSAARYAIATRQPVVVEVDISSRRFHTDTPPLDRTLPQTMALSVTVPETDRTGPDSARIRFGPAGYASGAQINLASGGVGARLEIDWLTGQVRLER